MVMDAFFLDAIVRELRSRLVPAAVNKIHQPGAHELVLQLWTGRETLRLLISVAPHAGRLHLLTTAVPNPAAPPRFCQLLRARLRRLLAITQPVGDRCVQMRFCGSDNEQLTLVAQLFGPQANLLLLDAGNRVIDALVRREGALPGQPYAAPPLPPRYPLAESLPEPLPTQPLADWLLENVASMTPLVAADLQAAVAAGLPPASAIAQLQQRWLAGDNRPALARWQGRPQLLAWLPDYLEVTQVQRFATPSLAAEACFAAINTAETFAAGPQELARLLSKAEARLQRRLQQIAEESAAAAGCERQREFGELLQGQRHNLRRGLEQVEVADWFATPPGPVVIPLDPALTPQENIERYFKRYRKGKRGLEHMTRRREETLAELEWLAGIGLALDEAGDADDLAEIRNELVEAGLLKVRSEPQRRRIPARSVKLHSGVTPGGFRVLWGKNNRSNDWVSTRLTAADDLWLHAHQLPGCHLVLKRDGRNGAIPEVDILWAAALAAGYSRGQGAAKVEVAVAQGCDVHKPKGARPGLVTVAKFRTVLVAPLRLAVQEE